MPDPIYIHRYTMRSVAGLNSQSESVEHEGALLRYQDGVGCIHPWQVLGDPSLDELLTDVRKGNFDQPIVKAALQCASSDGEARRRGVSLFDGVNVPRSHATVTGGAEAVEDAVKSGFGIVKLKVGKDVESELELLHHMHRKYPELRWRLDFNYALGVDALQKWVSSIDPSFRQQIDFLEDACSFDETQWRGLRDLHSIPLAVDFGAANASNQYAYAVVKPAVDDVNALCEKCRLENWKAVFTSYMDHPIGQCYAAWQAGQASARFSDVVDPTAGLMTHGLFEPNAFTERLGKPSPEWKSPGGAGLGFDDLLEEVDWKRIV